MGLGPQWFYHFTIKEFLSSLVFHFVIKFVPFSILLLSFRFVTLLWLINLLLCGTKNKLDELICLFQYIN